MADDNLRVLQKRAFVFCLRSIEQQLLRPESIEWPLMSDTWLGVVRSPALPLYRLYRVFRLAERNFPDLKSEAFSLLVRTFLRTGVKVRCGAKVEYWTKESYFFNFPTNRDIYARTCVRSSFHTAVHNHC